MELVREGLCNTGFSDVSLLSLSSGEYPGIADLMRELAAEFEPRGVSLSLPSLRVTSELMRFPEIIAGVRGGGMTFAPECATDALRARINKKVKNEELYAAVEAAYRAGFRTIKLYFMMGLPGESDDDVRAVAEMAHEVAMLRKHVAGGAARVNVSISNFIPKAQTPFQWAPMASLEELERKRAIIVEGVRASRASRNLNIRFHDRRMCEIEAVIARGDRRTADAIEAAYRSGEIFSAWDEHFSHERWLGALRSAGIDLQDAAHSEWPLERSLPWGHIDAGVSQDFLIKEWRRSLEGEETADCRASECSDCGADCRLVRRSFRGS